MKWFLALALCSATSAYASFEMALIADGTGQQIHRYDVDNRVYLGAINTGNNEVIRSMAVDQATGRLFVMTTGGRLLGYNYNTGNLLFIRAPLIANALLAFRPGYNDLIIASSSILRRFTFNADGTPNALLSYGTASAAVGAIAASGNDLILVNNGNVQRMTGQFSPTVTWQTTITAFTGDSFSGAHIKQNGTVYHVLNITESRMYAGLMNGTSVVSTNLPSVTGGILLGAHEFTSTILTAGPGSTSQMTRAYDDVLNSTVLAPWTLPSQIPNTYTAAVSVVAPEPTTWLVLGLGALGLRRKKR